MGGGNAVQGPRDAHQGRGVRDLRRTNPRTHREGRPGSWRPRLALPGSRERRLPPAARRAGLRAHAAPALVGPRLPDLATQQGTRRPSGRHALRAASAPTPTRLVRMDEPPRRGRATVLRRRGSEPRDRRAPIAAPRRLRAGAHGTDDAPLVPRAPVAATE